MSELGSADFGLKISFPDQSDSFVHGYEAGLLDAALKTETEPVERVMHGANRELIARMAKAYGWSVEIEGTDFDEWITAKLTRQPKPGPALRVVK